MSEYIKTKLKNKFNQNEITSLTNILFQEILKIDKNTFLSQKNYQIDKNKIPSIKKTIKKLLKDKPIQYIIGHTEFYELKLFVNKNVLIPRPETEELVNIILSNENLSEKNIIDIGTGSGCIAISIAKNSNANIFATDISKKAIKLAKKNAELNNTNIKFIKHNILKHNNIKINNKLQKFDFIISNPPYVRKKEIPMMKPNVLKYEPHLALFVNNNKPLIFYKAIAKFALNSLKNNGKIYLEINEFIAEQTADIFKKYNFNSTKIIKDLSGKKRFLIIKK